jgi:hypothetical protein
MRLYETKYDDDWTSEGFDVATRDRRSRLGRMATIKNNTYGQDESLLHSMSYSLLCDAPNDDSDNAVLLRCYPLIRLHPHNGSPNVEI